MISTGLPNRTLYGVFVVFLLLSTATQANAGHNPPRPQVSFECSRYALKFNPASDQWECAAGTRVKRNAEAKKRLRDLKRQVDTRIRELQKPVEKLQQEQIQRLQQLINQQRQLVRALQQN